MAEKKLNVSVEVKREMIESQHPSISIRRQCELIGLNRSTLYTQAVGETALNLELMRLIDVMYLVAIIDWYSRHVLAWQLSNTLNGSFCLETLNQALEDAQLEIFNTDQGSQFTAHTFTGSLG